MKVTELAATLAKLKLTMTAAECFTGGLFQSRICRCGQSSKIYHGGFITYSPGAMTALLGIPRKILSESGPVSEETAIAMAKACREALAADLGLSFTGVCGPEPVDGLAPGAVWLGVADCDSGFARQFLFEGTAQDILEQTVQEGATLLCTYALDNRGRLTCDRSAAA